MGIYKSPPPLSGAAWTSVSPGESYTLLDGTEAVANGTASYAFSLGYSTNGVAVKTFQISGCGNGSTVQIQASNIDVDANYVTVATPALVAGFGLYSDEGASQFYRAVVNVFVAGDKPVVMVQRT